MLCEFSFKIIVPSAEAQWPSDFVLKYKSMSLLSFCLWHLRFYRLAVKFQLPVRKCLCLQGLYCYLRDGARGKYLNIVKNNSRVLEMSDLYFLLVWAKPCKTWLVISDGVVVDVANERVGKVRFSFPLSVFFAFFQECLRVFNC